MSIHRLPNEPDVDTVWTVGNADDGRIVVNMRWERIKHHDGSPSYVWRSTSGVRRSWAELLSIGGDVYDHHPDLGAIAPAPWGYDYDEGFVDAHGETVRFTNSYNTDLVVRAVNFYVEQVHGGMTPLREQVAK